MISTLLINHIEVGKIEVDDMSGCITPKLQTALENEDYSLIMVSYELDLLMENIKVIYLLTEHFLSGDIEQTLCEFNSLNIEEWEEVHQLDFIED